MPAVLRSTWGACWASCATKGPAMANDAAGVQPRVRYKRLPSISYIGRRTLKIVIEGTSHRKKKVVRRERLFRESHLGTTTP